MHHLQKPHRRVVSLAAGASCVTRATPIRSAEPDLAETARAAVRDVLGEVTAIEDGEEIFAEVDLV